MRVRYLSLFVVAATFSVAANAVAQGRMEGDTARSAPGGVSTSAHGAPGNPPPAPPLPLSGGGSMSSEQLSLNFEKYKGHTESSARDVATSQDEPIGLLLPAVQPQPETLPPPSRSPQNAPAAQQGVQSNSAEQAALLVPAVQRVREAAARSRSPQAAGAQSDVTTEGDAQAARGTGTLTLSNGGGAAVMPEQPVCDHCGAHAEVQAQQQPAAEQQQRRRGRFSLSIGGVTLSSDGGVNIAVGDITGDGSGAREPQAAGRQHAPVRPVRESGGR